ncbi:RDD family protein, partial [Brevibacterium sp.]|uniref:RDD family protein n=1 Tax=Brevibacterium sp. TaxID=1701 RepID=UPI0025BDCBC1
TYRGPQPGGPVQPASPPAQHTQPGGQTHHPGGGMAQTAPGAVQFATPGQRLIARIIDWILLFGVGFLIALIPIVGWIVGPIVSMLLAVALELICNTTAGRTPGKKLMGIRIVREADGGRPSGGSFLTRALVQFGPGVLPVVGWIYQILVDLSLLFDSTPRRRSWQDRAGKTVVIVSP